jgi:CubicO group peptidase (beta-lactamase class C family)
MRGKSSLLGATLAVTMVLSPLGALASSVAFSGTSPRCAALDRQDPEHRQFYGDNPTYEDPTDDSSTWVLSDPASAGMNPSALARAAKVLARRPEQFSMIVAVGGKPVFERYFHGATRTSSNDVHSASKSLLSSAIGVAIREGAIPGGVNALVSNLLPPEYAALLTGNMKGWTLEQLLTMTSGLSWVEDSTETSIQDTPDWIRAILLRGISSVPGTTFNYSTAMTHLLSVILTEATGQSTCDYVSSRILSPIGAHPTRWDRDPQGYFSGGYNLYLRARDLADFGLMVEAGGVWNGVQIIPRDWLEDATKPQVSDGDTDGYSYGYDWWIKSISGHEVHIAWGFGGQFIYLVPDLRLMLVMTTNTAKYSSDATGESILSGYLIPGLARR